MRPIGWIAKPNKNEQTIAWTNGKWNELKKITRKLLCKAYVSRICDLFILLAHIRARFTAETDVWTEKNARNEQHSY